MSATTESPRLEAPGAGLPLSQRLVIRLWYAPVVSKRAPREENRKYYETIMRKLIEAASKLSPEQRDVKVLVRPMIGLEDSSRFWSINGVLEHLMVVGRSIETVIPILASGKVPDGVVDIAKVKPQGADHDLFAEFKEYAPGMVARLDERLSASKLDFDSPTVFKHPWFGMMTARQWYWLLCRHTGVHYAQAKAIVAGLSASSGSSRKP